MGTPLSCYRSVSIVADGRVDVCDGDHWGFVTFAAAHSFAKNANEWVSSQFK